MADAPIALDYADSRSRRSRRRFWMVALVVSALACGIVGRLLYARLAPVVANRLEAVDAQRRVDALNPNGVPFVVGRTPVDGETVTRDAAKISIAARQLFTSSTPGSGIVGIVRMQNAARADRVVCIALQTAGTSPVNSITLVAIVTRPASRFGANVSPQASVVPLVTYRGPIGIGPPTVDRADPRRLLLTGSSGFMPTVQFARELTIDVDDRVHVATIDVPATQPTP